jgi:hypothetical protein
MFLIFSLEFVAYTSFVNVEIYELYIPCFFLFVTDLYFCGTTLVKGEISCFLQLPFNRWGIHINCFIELKR